jgi:hypothetical protein
MAKLHDSESLDTALSAFEAGQAKGERSAAERAPLPKEKRP